MLLILVNHLGGLSLPRNNVGKLTDWLDMTLIVLTGPLVGNTWFKKKPEHLVTYQSGNAATQIDFILYRQSFRKQVSNVKVILGEECASQHRLLVGDFRVSIPPQPKRKFVPSIKVWELRDPGKQAELSEVFKAKTLDSELSQTSTVDERWTSLKDKLLQAIKQVCGVSSNHPWRKQTWW